MEIVPFASEDQEATTAFMRQIYQEMGWPEVPSDGLDDLTKYFHLPHEGSLLLIKDQGKVVGTGGFVKRTDNDILLKRFYIDKNLRGSGIAQTLWKNFLRV